MEHEGDGDTDCSWHTVTKGLGLEDLKRREHRNNCIVEIGQNNNKSPGDLRGLAVSQTQVESHQLRVG